MGTASSGALQVNISQAEGPNKKIVMKWFIIQKPKQKVWSAPWNENGLDVFKGVPVVWGWQHAELSNNDHRKFQSRTYSRCLSTVRSNHQSRAATVVHRIDFCTLIQDQLEPGNITRISCCMQRGPATAARSLTYNMLTFSWLILSSILLILWDTIYHQPTFLWHHWCSQCGGQQLSLEA